MDPRGLAEFGRSLDAALRQRIILAACTLVCLVSASLGADQTLVSRMSVVTSVAQGEEGVDTAGARVECVFFESDRAADGSIERCFPVSFESAPLQPEAVERSPRRLVVLEAGYSPPQWAFSRAVRNLRTAAGPLAGSPRSANQAVSLAAGPAPVRAAASFGKHDGVKFTIDELPTHVLELRRFPRQPDPSWVVRCDGCPTDCPDPIETSCPPVKVTFEVLAGGAGCADIEQPVYPTFEPRRVGSCFKLDLEFPNRNHLPHSNVTNVVEVPIFDDNVPEAPETFTIQLTHDASEPVRKTVSIIDNDTLTIDDSTVTVTEGETARFKVTLEPPPDGPARINYVVEEETAEKADFDPGLPLSGTLEIKDVASGFIDVKTRTDGVDEPPETFTVRLTHVDEEAITSQRSNLVAKGTIEDTDPPPSISISNASVLEGKHGKADAIFEVTLSEPSSFAVSVDYETQDGTAELGDNDYEKRTGTITIAAGLTSEEIIVHVLGDEKPEDNETFNIVLSDPVNATIANTTAVGTIENDDPPDPIPGMPQLEIMDAPDVLQNGAGPTVDAVFEVTLSKASEMDVLVDFRTRDGPATATTGAAMAGIDYIAQQSPPKLRIRAGQTSAKITVRVLVGATSERDETFSVELSNPTNAVIARATALCTIKNVDSEPPAGAGQLSFSASSFSSAGDTATIRVTRENGSAGMVTVDYDVQSGRGPNAAIAGVDFVRSPGTLTWGDGVRGGKTFEVEIRRTSEKKWPLHAELTLSNPTAGAKLGELKVAILRIQGDDRTSEICGYFEGEDPRSCSNLSLREDTEARLLDNRLFVEVKDDNDLPVGNRVVNWIVQRGGQVGFGETGLPMTNTKTDDTGRSSIRLKKTADTIDDTIVVKARCDGCREGDRATFRIRAKGEEKQVKFGTIQLTSVREDEGTIKLPVECKLPDCSGLEVEIVKAAGEVTEGKKCESNKDFVLGNKGRTRFRKGERKIEFSIDICNDDVPECNEDLKLALIVKGAEQKKSITLTIVDDDGGCPGEMGLDDGGLDDVLEPVSVPIAVTPHLAEVNLGNVLSRLAALRRGGPALGTEFAALEIQGVTVPIDLLAHLGTSEETDEFDIARLLSGEERGSGASGDGEAAEPGSDDSKVGMFVSGILAFGERQESPADCTLNPAVLVSKCSKPADSKDPFMVSGFDFHTDGLMVGMDYRFEKFVAGGAVSYSSTRSELDDEGGQVDTEGLNLSSYFLFGPFWIGEDNENSNIYLDTVLSWGRNDFKQHRSEPAEDGEDKESAKADFSGNQFTLYVGSGYERNVGALVLGGHGGLSYFTGTVDAYQEKGNASFLAVVDSHKVESLLVSVGLDLSYYLWIKGGVLAPGLRFAYRKELEDDVAMITGLLRSTSPQSTLYRFSVETSAPDRDYFNVGFNLLGSFEWGSVFMSYDQDLARSDFSLEALTAGVRFGF